MKRIIPFYRIIKKQKLFSFDDEIGTVPVCGKPLSFYQENLIQRIGSCVQDIEYEEEINENEYFVFDNDLFFSEKFLKQVKRSYNADQDSKQFILSPNEFNDRFVLPDSKDENQYLKYNFFYRNKKSKKSREIVVQQKLYDHYIMLPDQIVKGGNYYYGPCDTFISRIASPFHLLQINMAVNLLRTVRLFARYPEWIRERFAQSYSHRYSRALRSLNKIGKNCRIHRSAVIEGAQIGDNVIIGANTTVRLSIIGDGTYISDNIGIQNSVIGKNNYISNSNFINNCVTYDDVFLIHGPYQFSVFGRSSAVFATINCDIRLDQKTVKIPTDNGLIDSNQPLLGIAYGHHSKVGGGNIIASGRIVPNHLHIVPPESIIMKF